MASSSPSRTSKETIMARVAKSVNNIQVFRGSRPKMDVFSANSGIGCCDPGLLPEYDKLAERTRFDNALAHSNPTGANDKYRFPSGNGFDSDRAAIINHINTVGVGATISVLAVPTYAFVTGIGVHVEAEEPGLTFNIITRNGLALPNDSVIQVAAAAGALPCEVTRTQSAGSLAGFGALGTDLFRDIFAREANGSFALEADEIILQVATIPVDPVVGLFDITVALSYDVIHRAEQ
jgi:hypothetical protein